MRIFPLLNHSPFLFMTPRFTSTVSAKRVTRYLYATIVALGIAHLIGLSAYCLTRSSAVNELFKIVNFDRERNLPTLFCVSLLLLNGALFWIIHRNSRAFRERQIAWPLLGGTFAFLGLDEFGGLHEEFSAPLRAVFHTHGTLLHDAWLIPYGIAAIIIATIVLPTIVKLRGNVRLWLLMAAGLYITGAIGFEMVGGLMAGSPRDANFLYGVLVGGSKLLEMSGLATLAYALLTLIEQQYGGFTLMIPQHNPIKYKYNIDPIPPVPSIDFNNEFSHGFNNDAMPIADVTRSASRHR
jgi:hypothetical protein